MALLGLCANFILGHFMVFIHDVDIFDRIFSNINPRRDPPDQPLLQQEADGERGQVSFSKRRGRLLKKAHEIAVLCDAQIGLILFSSSGQMFEYCSPNSSMRQIIDRFKEASGTRIQEYDDKQTYREMTKIKNENDKLQATMRQLTGEGLTTLTKTDLKHLQKQLEVSLDRVRSREVQ
ncbi:MADS-box protein GGM13-like [Nymphaea colorata]|nr:MADS-box protein GGM13-like [Nymphaea colorata]